MTDEATNQGTKDDPWKLQTASQTSSYEMYRDESADPPVLVCQVGKTQLQYDLRAIDDLHAMLLADGDWMPIGGTDEQKSAPEGSVEAWGRVCPAHLGAGGFRRSGRRTWPCPQL